MHNEVVNSFKGSGNIMNHQSKLYFFLMSPSQANPFLQLLKQITPPEHARQQSKRRKHPPGCMASVQCKGWEIQKNHSKSCCFWSLNHWIKALAIVVTFSFKSQVLIKKPFYFRCIPVLTVSSTEQEVNTRLCMEYGTLHENTYTSGYVCPSGRSSS